jgi:hypothetical protein
VPLPARRPRCCTPWSLIQGPDRGTSSPRRWIASLCGDGGAPVTGALCSANTFVRETERVDRDWCKLRQSPVRSSHLFSSASYPPSARYAQSPQVFGARTHHSATISGSAKDGRHRAGDHNTALRTGRSAINRNDRSSPSPRMHIPYPRGSRRKPPPQNADSDTAATGVVAGERRPVPGMSPPGPALLTTAGGRTGLELRRLFFG